MDAGRGLFKDNGKHIKLYFHIGGKGAAERAVHKGAGSPHHTLPLLIIDFAFRGYRSVAATGFYLNNVNGTIL